VEGRASLSREVGADLRIRNLAIGSLWMLPAFAAFAVFSPWHTLAALAAVLATCALFLRGVRRKLGGVTGDCLGCLCYLVQIVVLLVAAAQPGASSLPSPPGSGAAQNVAVPVHKPCPVSVPVVCTTTPRGVVAISRGLSEAIPPDGVSRASFDPAGVAAFDQRISSLNSQTRSRMLARLRGAVSFPSRPAVSLRSTPG